MTPLFVFLLGCLATIQAQPAKDKITALKGYSGPLGNQWSGYINVASTGRFLHYWFIESFGNPSTDPVTVWLNGGPGCSSMDGLLYEMGPIHFNNIPNSMDLVFNPYTWVNVSSMLFIEAPAGVGFSYSNNQQDYNTNDTQTAADNYKLLQEFTTLFPKYKNQDLWIAGESYAGIYVPTLADLVLTGVQKGQFSMNFKGVLVGNGVARGAPSRSIPEEYQWGYGHALFPKSVMDAIYQFCPSDPNGQLCQKALDQAENGFSGFNPYFLYGDCTSQRPTLKFEGNSYRPSRSPRVGGDVPCIDSFKANDFLNDPTVKSQIHVNPSITWTICSDTINYSEDYGSVMPIYQRLLKANKKVLIYSGDADSVVDYTYTENWTENLKLTPYSSWRQWTFTDNRGEQIGGFVTEYSEGLAFATITGAGHMVPQYRPKPAYAMFQRFTSGKPL